MGTLNEEMMHEDMESESTEIRLWKYVHEETYYAGMVAMGNKEPPETTDDIEVVLGFIDAPEINKNRLIKIIGAKILEDKEEVLALLSHFSNEVAIRLAGRMPVDMWEDANLVSEIMANMQNRISEAQIKMLLNTVPEGFTESIGHMVGVVNGVAKESASLAESVIRCMPLKIRNSQKFALAIRRKTSGIFRELGPKNHNHQEVIKRYIAEDQSMEGVLKLLRNTLRRTINDSTVVRFLDIRRWSPEDIANAEMVAKYIVHKKESTKDIAECYEYFNNRNLLDALLDKGLKMSFTGVIAELFYLHPNEEWVVIHNNGRKVVYKKWNKVIIETRLGRQCPGVYLLPSRYSPEIKKEGMYIAHFME